MADLARIKNNVRKMAEQNAPESDIDGYIASEGVTVDEVRAFKPEAAPAAEQPGMGMDILRSAGTGIRQGLEGLGGMFGDANKMTGDVAGWAAGKLGLGESGQDVVRNIGRRLSPTGMLPSTDEIQTGTKAAIGEHYQPQTVAGEYAKTIGEFAPGGFAGPGGLVRKTAMTVIPAVASETAGQVTKGTAAEPYARAVAGIAAGGLAAGKPRMAPAQTAPTAAELKREGGAMYKAADMTNVGVKAGAVKKALGNAQIKLEDFAFDPQLQPDTAIVLKKLAGAAKAKGMNLAELENVRKMAGNVARTAAKSDDRQTAGILIEQIDNMMDDAGNFAANSNEAIASLKNARETWKRARKTETIEEIVEKAQNQQTGFENGLVIHFRALANNPKRFRQFSKSEQDMIKGIVRRPSLHGAMRAIGMLAPNSTFGGMMAGGVGVGSGVLPAAILAGTGYGARKLAGNLTRGKVDRLQGAVASGQMPQKGQLNVDAAIRALLAAESGKNSAVSHSPVR